MKDKLRDFRLESLLTYQVYHAYPVNQAKFPLPRATHLFILNICDP